MPRTRDGRTPGEKLLSLFSLLLATTREYSLKELADYLEVSKQTVLRLIDQLESARFGGVVQQRRGRENYYTLKVPKEYAFISLGREILPRLLLCNHLLQHMLPKSVKIASTENFSMECREKQVERRPGAICKKTASNAVSSAPSSLVCNFLKGGIDYTGHEIVVQQIMDAVLAKHVCAVTYEKADGQEQKTFYFAPIRILALRGTWYVQGWVLAQASDAAPRYDSPTNLLLHRIWKVETTTFSSSQLPDIAELDSDYFGLMGEDLFRVRIRFHTPESMQYAKERKWSKDQEITHFSDGSMELAFTARSRHEVVSLILSFGSSVSLQEPMELRQWIYEELTGALQRYEGTGNNGN